MTYKKIQSFIFLTVLTMSFVLLLYIFWPYLNGLILALILGIVFWPLYEKILVWCKNKKAVASLLTVFIVVLSIVAPFVFVTSQAVREINIVYEHIVSVEKSERLVFISDTEESISNYFGMEKVDIVDAAKSGINWFAKNLGSFVSSATQLIINLLISLIALYYIFKEREFLKGFLITFSPLSDKYDKLIIDKIGSAVNSVIRGAIIIAVIQGILTGAGFLIFGVPNPTLWGSVAALSSLIPNVGTALVVVPGIIYLFLMGKTGAAIGLLLWGFLAVGLIDNFLGPQFMKKGMTINPFLILLSILGGLSAFGPIGFVLGPLIISVFLVLIEIYKTEFKEYLETQRE